MNERDLSFADTAPIRIEAWAKIHCRNSKSERAGLAVAKLIV